MRLRTMLTLQSVQEDSTYNAANFIYWHEVQFTQVTNSSQIDNIKQ